MPSEKKCACGNRCIANSGDGIEPEYIEVNGKYYHKDCYEIKQGIEQIRDYFHNHINPSSPFGLIMKVLNDMVYECGIHPNMIKYGLRLWKSKGKKINYPQGLKYITQDVEVIQGYKKLTSEKIRKEKVEIQEDTGVKFTYIPHKTKDIEDLFR